MSPFMTILTILSMAGLLTISIYKCLKSKNLKIFIIQIVIILLAFSVLYFIFYSKGIPTSRGAGSDDIYLVIVLYFFMLLGMLAQYLYNRFEQPKSQRKEFDFGLFIAPIFASPIIFIPLLAALQNAEIDLKNLTVVKSMIFFVAFENGFFWKEYFDHRRQQKMEGSDEPKQTA